MEKSLHSSYYVSKDFIAETIYVNVIGLNMRSDIELLIHRTYQRMFEMYLVKIGLYDKPTVHMREFYGIKVLIRIVNTYAN